MSTDQAIRSASGQEWEKLGYSYEELLELKRKFKESPLYNSKKAYEKFKKSFAIKYAHDSTAIEGNTLTLAQVKTILEDKIPVRGKNLREIYEVVNHKDDANLQN